MNEAALQAKRERKKARRKQVKALGERQIDRVLRAAPRSPGKSLLGALTGMAPARPLASSRTLPVMNAAVFAACAAVARDGLARALISKKMRLAPRARSV